MGKAALQVGKDSKTSANTNTKESLANLPAGDENSSLADLMRQEQGANYLPPQLRKKKQKRKVRSLEL